MIQLIVGLGNPGKEYEQTRHNVGALFVEKLATLTQVSLKKEAKFHGFYSKANLNGDHHLLIPTTYMNLSGQAVQAIADFYKIQPASILVAHDDLDLPFGDVRLKVGGGHGGHNGLKSIIAHLNSNDFIRLRFGIDHPGDRSAVTSHVLGKMNQQEMRLTEEAIDRALKLMPLILSNELSKAMQELHTH